MLRNPDSIPAGDTIIEDPALEPFFITHSQVGGYVVYERVVKGENKNNYLKTIGYPSNFNYALKMVSRLIEKKGGNPELVNIAKRSEPLVPTPPPGFERPIKALKK